MTYQHSRRAFLGHAGLGVAGLAAAAYTTAAEDQPTSKNDTIQIGVIGTGGRARARLMPAINKIPGAGIVAVCDVYKDHLEAGRVVAGGEDIFTTADHHELLDRSDIDAVVIATPDHWHVPASIDACEAGKDVYVEKPLTHQLGEGEALIEARDRNDRVVQVGAQQRSMPQFAKARQIIREGKLGKIHKVHMQWNRNFLPYRKPEFRIDPGQVDWRRFLGNAPDQPFDPWRFRSWRWVWDFGNGILTDLMVHWMDAVDWLLDLEEPPKRITSIGGNYATEGVWETPDTIQTVFEYPDRQCQMHFEGTFVNKHNRAMVTIMGEDATLYLDRGRYELHPEPFREVEADREVFGEGGLGADFYDEMESDKHHLMDWLEAVRARRQPVEPVEAGIRAAAVAHYGNQAYREGRVLTLP